VITATQCQSRSKLNICFDFYRVATKMFDCPHLLNACDICTSFYQTAVTLHNLTFSVQAVTSIIVRFITPNGTTWQKTTTEFFAY